MNRLIRRKEVEKMTGLVKSSLYAKIKEDITGWIAAKVEKAKRA